MKKLMMLVLILALALCSVPAALAEGDTPDALADAHGSLVSANGEPVTDEEIAVISGFTVDDIQKRRAQR